MNCRFLVSVAAALLSGTFSATVGAQDLVQVYRDARSYDAQFAAARFALEAGREKLPQGEALRLPTASLTGNLNRSHIDFDSRNSVAAPSFGRDTRSHGFTVTLTQPIYRPQNTLARTQADHQVRQAEAAFSTAAQDLVVRTAQAYFDVLASQNQLELVTAQKAAISEQLAQARRNFEVGTATITDTHEAQARFDLIVAQEIAAQNDLENRRRNLQQITGKEYPALRQVRSDVQLAAPNPASMQAWVELAERQSYTVQAQAAVTEIAALEAQRQRAGHYPTLDLVGSHNYNNQSSSASTAIGSDTNTTTLSLQFALPLYAGGAINSREREAAFNYERSKQDLENARRAAALAARQSYLAVMNGIAQTRALEQALVSSKSALESNRLGYEVGVRINIDVLNAQQQVFSTQRDLAAARYNTITSLLRLKAAGGTLREEDLEEVNKALQ